MPTIVLRDYIYDDLGQPVGGIRARAYPKIGLGSRELSHVGAEDFSRSDTGMWELTLDTNTSPTGLFTIEMYNPSTGQIRWRDGHVRLQVEALIGAHGGVPISDQSITTAKIQDGAITNAKIADGSLSSMKLQASDRTIDQTTNTLVNTGSLGQLLSGLGRQIRLITGQTDWKSAPPANLGQLFTHINNTSLHANPERVMLSSAAPLTTGYAQGVHQVRIAAGSVNVVTANSTGSFYINTLMNGIISIQLTDGSTGTTPQAIGVMSHESSFPDSTNLITFRVYPTVANNTQIRVNFLVVYW